MTLLNTLLATNVIGLQPKKDGKVIYASAFYLGCSAGRFFPHQFPTELPLKFLEIVGAEDRTHLFSYHWYVKDLTLLGTNQILAKNSDGTEVHLYLYQVQS